MAATLGGRLGAAMRLLAVAGVLAMGVSATVASAGQKVGIVLLHGELGAPGRVIDGLGQALAGAGYLVSRPDMCWSARRGYEQTFPDCLAVVDDAIVKLRNLGATQIAVGGFSLGGTAAIAYCADHAGCRVTFAIAPDHDARSMARQPDIAASLQQARALVGKGHGDDSGTFIDIGIGPEGTYETEIATTPAIYVSFFGADSQATVAGAIGRLTAPLLWAAGGRDPGQAGSAALFALAPRNALSRYVAVDSTHLGTPDAARQPVLAWLTTVVAQ
jgi:pimeloyl-ACP methyl ester carboxylesterase